MLKLSNSLKTAASVAVLAAVAFIPATAQAQQTQKSAPTQSAAPQANFTDAKLKAFINSASEIQKLQQKWLPKLKEAPTAEQQQALQEKIRGEMTSVIKNTDNITVAEFQQISVRSREDNQLAQRINTIAQNMAN